MDYEGFYGLSSGGGSGSNVNITAGAGITLSPAVITDAGTVAISTAILDDIKQSQDDIIDLQAEDIVLDARLDQVELDIVDIKTDVTNLGIDVGILETALNVTNLELSSTEDLTRGIWAGGSRTPYTQITTILGVQGISSLMISSGPNLGRQLMCSGLLGQLYNCYYSDDGGLNWLAASGGISAAGTFGYNPFNGNLFFVNVANGDVWFSSDYGTSFSLGPGAAAALGIGSSAAADGYLWVERLSLWVLPFSGTVATSPDFLNFTLRPTMDRNFRNIVDTGTYIVVVGQTGASRSLDGISWITTDVTLSTLCAAYSAEKNVIACVGFPTGSTIRFSTDRGLTFQTITNAKTSTDYTRGIFWDSDIARFIIAESLPGGSHSGYVHCYSWSGDPKFGYVGGQVNIAYNPGSGSEVYNIHYNHVWRSYFIGSLGNGAWYTREGTGNSVITQQALDISTDGGMRCNNLTCTTIDFLTPQGGKFLQLTPANIHTTSVAEVDLLAGATYLGSLSQAAYTFTRSAFHFVLYGSISAANNDIFTFRFKFGAVVMTLAVTMFACTAESFELECDFSVTALGGLGVASVSGNLELSYSDTSNDYHSDRVTAINSTQFDTNIQNIMQVTIQYSSPSASNSMQCVRGYMTKVY